jgi:hypothetical protein
LIGFIDFIGGLMMGSGSVYTAQFSVMAGLYRLGGLQSWLQLWLLLWLQLQRVWRQLQRHWQLHELEKEFIIGM